jgi:hypothetical protein
MFALITDCNQIKQDNAVDIHDLVDRYGIYVSQKTTNMLRLSKSQFGRFFIHDLSPGL